MIIGLIPKILVKTFSLLHSLSSAIPILLAGSVNGLVKVEANTYLIFSLLVIF